MEEQSTRLKILAVGTGLALAPRSGGELRTHHLCRSLARLGHRVDLVSFVTRNHPCDRRRSQSAEMPLSVEQRHAILLDLAAVCDRIGLIPITELPVWLRPLRGWLSRLVRRNQYDIVQFESPWFASLAPAVPESTMVVYDAHDVASVWWEERLRRRWLGSVFERRLRCHETAASQSAQRVLVCSEADGKWFEREAGIESERIAVIPNGFDGERFVRPQPDQRGALRRHYEFAEDKTIALFVGSNTPPNREAARWIVERLWPGLKARPGGSRIHFVIAGKVCDGLDMPVAGLAGEIPAKRGRIELLGPVEDVLPLMQAADIGLNPMQSGSGSNLKLIEYAAAGLPVATTEFGLRGFEPLRRWTTVAKLDGFADALMSLHWPGKAPEEELAAYSWRSIAGKLARLYADKLRS